MGSKEAMVRRGIGEGSMVVKNLRVVEAVRTQGIVARGSKLWGLPLGFRRLWGNQGLPEILHRVARGSRVALGGHNYLFRTDLQGAAHQAFSAAGGRPPPLSSK